jgi:hypothetical protein
MCAGMDYNKDMDLGSVGLGSFNVADCMGYCYATYPAAMGGVLLIGSNWCVCKGPMVGTPTPQGTQGFGAESRALTGFLIAPCCTHSLRLPYWLLSRYGSGSP